MATTIVIEDEADAALSEQITEMKLKARKTGKPTREITKMRLVSNLIKKAFRKPKLTKPSETPTPEA